LKYQKHGRPRKREKKANEHPNMIDLLWLSELFLMAV